MPTPQQIPVAPLQFIGRQQSPATDCSPVAWKALCSTCYLKAFCLPSGLTGRDVERLDDLHFARRSIHAGQTLYRQGEKFQFIYAVRGGTFKSNLTLTDGREQVTGFHMAGELLGFDGLASGQHASSAVALEDAEICAIPYDHLSELAKESPDLQLAISRIMSREIVREHSLMMLLGSMNAEERLAAFLLNISQRMKARGYSASEFHLRMSVRRSAATWA